MANGDASSSTTCTVRVLVSFYLASTDYSSSYRTLPIHKEKFNVPLSGDEHKDLFNFVRYLKTFTGFAEIAKSTALRENPELLSIVLGKKSGIRETDEKRAGCGILAQKGRECGIRIPLPLPDPQLGPQTNLSLFQNNSCRPPSTRLAIIIPGKNLKEVKVFMMHALL